MRRYWILAQIAMRRLWGRFLRMIRDYLTGQRKLL